MIISVCTGLAAGIDGYKIIDLLKTGFGKTLEKVGLLIILGTTLGILLEKTGATLSLAEALLRRTGEKGAPLAIVLTAFSVGLPIFCDSGYVVLIGLVLMLGQRIPDMRLVLVLCLASALYTVHCLVPPHPGISAAAATMKVDLGKAMLLGAVVAIPPTIAAYFWSLYAGKKYLSSYNPAAAFMPQNEAAADRALPAPWKALLPIVIPISLIAFKSIWFLWPQPEGTLFTGFVRAIGEPVSALLVGILLTLRMLRPLDKKVFNTIAESGIEKSGPILAIIAMGGAFGEIIKALDLGKVYGSAMVGTSWGIVVPFILTVVFKTAQGSSTVAVMSAASIIEPLAATLGLDSEWGRLLSLLAMGAGSMMLSHANDAYFWVISRFSQMDTSTTLRTYSVGSVIMGLVTFATVWLIFLLSSDW